MTNFRAVAHRFFFDVCGESLCRFLIMAKKKKFGLTNAVIRHNNLVDSIFKDALDTENHANLPQSSK